MTARPPGHPERPEDIAAPRPAPRRADGPLVTAAAALAAAVALTAAGRRRGA
ncbi:hypothetical protein [Streptomyces marincola]|uniref:hypothetical protein n=1 Tax=Streptomyces marincola TaxID=2878388 RepID=UPI001CF18098|nr:hypothetical protein [Streptomyces marincola]UCM87893.1 hypothetical protein LC193_07950 [Streptomyces marincola]